MARKSVHTPVVSREELRRVVPPEKLGPNSPLLEKPRKKRDDPEHRAQVRFYEKLDDEAWSERGLSSGLRGCLPYIHAIPQFNANIKGWKAKQIGARFLAEGQKAGVPDNHIPVLKHFTRWGWVAGLYLELKYEGYPSEPQRKMGAGLALCGSMVLVVRKPDVEALSDLAVETVLRYLEGADHVIQYSHPRYTYLP